MAGASGLLCLSGHCMEMPFADLQRPEEMNEKAEKLGISVISSERS
jgi:hypothetical protein